MLSVIILFGTKELWKELIMLLRIGLIRLERVLVIILRVILQREMGLKLARVEELVIFWISHIKEWFKLEALPSLLRKLKAKPVISLPMISQ